MTKLDESLSTLISQLAERITAADFVELRQACKDDDISEDNLKKISSPKELFEFLCEKKLLSQDDPSFIEHVFELCRRPDLLTVVMDYRLSNLGIGDDAQLGKKLIRVRSAKKYTEQDETSKHGEHTLKLSDPPKARRKSSSTR